MKLDGARVLVTGANGFVGGWVSRMLLNAGAEVVGLVRNPKNNLALKLHLIDSEVRPRKCDITDLKGVLRAFKALRPDAVVHLAAQSSARVKDDGLQTYRVNVEGTANVLNACAESGVQNVVVASTGKAYGEHGARAVNEADALTAQSMYGASKACMDLMSQAFAETYGLNLVLTRCGNVYGPIDLGASRLIPSTTLKALKGERPIINNRAARRDFVYVKDVAKAYGRILERIERKGVRRQAFNIASGKQRKVTDVVAEVLKLTHAKARPVVKKGKSSEEQEPVFSVKKATQALGWKAETPFKEGLKRTVEWIAENKAWYPVK